MSNAPKAREIFEQAIEITVPDEQLRFIQSACEGDVELLAAVQSLLHANQNIGELFETQDMPQGENQMTSTHDSPRNYSQSETIGPYKLLQEIGSGGMGQVWMAEQQRPVRRRVALKLIKAGMDTKLVIARFEAERQALALMDHPHIAKVFDAGTSDDGRPYFVMEYVRGKLITKFADDNHLTIPERLELFEQVCNAVQHAHHKGIIHRDLKPSNVLVSAPDGKPVSKVIDFGIAKATSQQLTDLTLYTMHDQFIGTPQYMSPEQAAGSVDIDTRTDVYSLGVILFELLTGSTPFPKEELQAAGLEKMKAIIIEQEPPKPSTRISLSQQTIDFLAASRKVETKRLGNLVRGELDWIVMKALDKERGRRYETPNSFSEDILAYLQGEPIDAAPPSRLYRLQKFVRKNRGQVLAASIFLLLLLFGLGGTTWGLFRAKIAEQKTRTALQQVSTERDAKAEALDAERIQRQRAEHQQEIAETNLTRGILRPIGFGYTSGALNEDEFISIRDWSQLTSSRLKLMVLEQAFENPESALRLVIRGQRGLQACIGTSIDRRQLVIEKLNHWQAETTTDIRISFAACRLAVQLGDRNLPHLEPLLQRILDQSEKRGPSVSGDDLFALIKQWVQLANNTDQIERALNTLIEVLGKADDGSALTAAGQELMTLAARLEGPQIERALNTLIEVVEKTDDDALYAAGEGLTALAARLEGPQIEHAWNTLIDVVEKTGDEGVLYVAGEGLTALATRLEGPQIERALNTLLEVVEKTDSWNALSVASKGLTALATRLEGPQIERAWNTLIEILEKTDEGDVLEVAGEGLTALATRLEGPHIEHAWNTLIDVVEKTDDRGVLAAASKGLTALAARREGPQIERALNTFIEILENTNDEYALYVAGEGLTTLAAGLEGPQIERTLNTLIEVVEKTDNEDALQAAAKGLMALTAGLEGPQIERTLNTLIEVATKTDDWDAREAAAKGLAALAAGLEGPQIERALNTLIEVVEKTDDWYALEAAGKGLTALAAGLEGPQIERAWNTLIEILENTDHWDPLRAAGKGLTALAAGLEGPQIERAWNTLIEVLENTDNGTALRAAGKVLTTLAAGLEGPQIERAWNTLIKVLAKTRNWGVYAAAKGLTALAARLEGPQIERAWNTLIEVLAKTDDGYAPEAAGKGLTALAARLEGPQIERAWNTLIEILAKTDDWDVVAAASRVLAELAKNQTDPQVNSAIKLALLRWLELSAVRVIAPDQEPMVRLLKFVSKPKDIGNWLQHPGAVGALRFRLLRRMDEIAHHDSQPIYSDFRLAELAAEDKKESDQWTEADEIRLTAQRDALPPRKIRTIHDAALWLQKHQPDFDLDKPFDLSEWPIRMSRP